MDECIVTNMEDEFVTVLAKVIDNIINRTLRYLRLIKVNMSDIGVICVRGILEI